MIRPSTLPTAMLLLLCAGALGSCGDPESLPEPLDPVADDDPGSRLARALRSRNAALTTNGQVPTEAEIAGLADELRTTLNDVETLAALEDLQSVLQASPDEYVSPVWVNRVLAGASREGRDTIYVFYGHLSDTEIDQERTGWNLQLERWMPWLGYQVSIDRDATFDEWSDAVLGRRAAGIVWRSHGNLSPSPYEPGPDHFMARVLATEKSHGSRSRLFARDWAALLPEGLGMLSLSSCMTDGLFLPDDLDLVEDLGGTTHAEARLSTFETEIGDRALYYRGYRGPSFSPTVDPLGWWALTRLLPRRSEFFPQTLESDPDALPPDLLAGVEAGVIDGAWIPRLLETVASFANPRQAEAVSALEALSAVLGHPLAYAGEAEWRDWWAGEEVQLAHEAEVAVQTHRPTWDLLWAHLWGDFDRQRHEMNLDPVSIEAYCWLDWFRCILESEAHEEIIEGEGGARWRMTVARDADTADYPCPIPQDLVVTFDPATSRLDHNLGDLVRGVDYGDISCTSL